MLKVTAEEIARALGYNYSGLNDKIITSVTCDSREVTEGSLFIALAGEKTDGHNYIAKAYENGASGRGCEAARLLLLQIWR